MYIRKILITVVLLGLVAAGAFAYFVYNALFTPNTSFNNDEAYVYIPSDAGFSELRELVTPLIEDMDTFDAVARRKKYDQNVKGGKYAIRKGMNNNDIINALRSGNIPVKVSFNNQERLPDLAGRISEQIEADSISLLRTMSSTEFLESNDFDENSAISLYIPNSYEFFWNTNAEEFRARMLKEYNRFWNDERREKASALGLDIKKVSALASIVQKETAKVDERPRVAGLYLNRIKSNMRLQADPTVIFAIKHHTGNYDTIIKRVLYRDLELDSPYNTYKYPGIPPGPITMPDISSIDAVLNAENHNYYYMVANVSNFGYHKFAQTIQQHNRNKSQYIRWINAQNINR
ncbi:endolytic transglycosylase MltG [Poritiphilus flavus]|uniref:Endolytic murein transglycosylase n=1 Tax=Poritiphilus flavus TaxID=2697053 RepID=A0A6L9EGI1_9FLAO|nr:endolytic transglycosylase MltG [Poritiphilus flavus]NAS13359.1 endolytic transglycosylase MltG [Poritiphilus flavus]